MLAMFSVFAVLCYLDGNTRYRQNNLAYYLHHTFEKAAGDFAKMNLSGGLSEVQWRQHVASQTVALSAELDTLPKGLNVPMAWPEILGDYQQMKTLQWESLWTAYSSKAGYDLKPVEHPYDRRKIQEQWVMFWVCVICSLITLAILLRTMRRSLQADDEYVTGVTGVKVAYHELKTLDLRKWQNKGLAYLDYEGVAGKGRLRIDGLTYGGFKKEQGEPAEQFMRQIRERFSGEVIEYVTVTEGDEAPEGGQKERA